MITLECDIECKCGLLLIPILLILFTLIKIQEDNRFITLKNIIMKKSDIIRAEVPSLITKVGDKVICIDGSYAVDLNEDGLNYDSSIGLSDEVFTVIAINVDCPSGNPLIDTLGVKNNCIIRSDEGNIHFVSHINIENIRCIFNGVRIKEILDCEVSSHEVNIGM